jgi:transposase
MALKISKGVVAKYVALSKAAGLNWELIQAMTEAQLQARLLPGRLVDGGNAHYRQPDFAQIHRELSRKGMTLMLPPCVRLVSRHEVVVG